MTPSGIFFCFDMTFIQYLLYCTKNQGTKHETFNTVLMLDSIPHSLSLPVGKSSSFPHSKTLAGPLDPYDYDLTPVARCSCTCPAPPPSSHLRVHDCEVVPHTLAPFIRLVHLPFCPLHESQWNLIASVLGAVGFGIRSRTVQPIVIHYTDWATRPTNNTW